MKIQIKCVKIEELKDENSVLNFDIWAVIQRLNCTTNEMVYNRQWFGINNQPIVQWLELEGCTFNKLCFFVFSLE